MTKGQIIQKSVGLYPDDWAEIDTLARAMKLPSSSAAVRMIVDFWRQNRDPRASTEMTQLRELAITHYREQITDSEFATEAGILILVGDH